MTHGLEPPPRRRCRRLNAWAATGPWLSRTPQAYTAQLHPVVCFPQPMDYNNIPVLFLPLSLQRRRVTAGVMDSDTAYSHPTPAENRWLLSHKI